MHSISIISTPKLTTRSQVSKRIQLTSKDPRSITTFEISFKVVQKSQLALMNLKEGQISKYNDPPDHFT